MFTGKMARLSLLILCFGILLYPGAGAEAQESPVGITFPVGGEALQGVVSINGTTAVEGFRSVEIAFSYQADRTGSWFLIDQKNEPVNAGELARWDTTTISDGVYRLRMKIFLQDGQVLESQVTGLRVRNYSPVETSTPAPLAGTQAPAKPEATATPWSDFQPSRAAPTPLPTNPAILTPGDIQRSALQGVSVVFGFLLVAGIYFGIRSLGRG